MQRRKGSAEKQRQCEVRRAACVKGKKQCGVRLCLLIQITFRM